MASNSEQLELIHGNGLEFREAIGRQLVTAILTRNDAEYDRLRSSLRPTVNLTVVASPPSDVIGK